MPLNEFMELATTEICMPVEPLMIVAEAGVTLSEKSGARGFGASVFNLPLPHEMTARQQNWHARKAANRPGEKFMPVKTVQAQNSTNRLWKSKRSDPNRIAPGIRSCILSKQETPMAPEIIETECCVVGGGPAGMMFGFLLARRGVQVTVLEKHRDFFRDFRGDTVHPSTLEVLKELGLLKEFLELPHHEVASVGVVIGDSSFEVADFRHVPATCKFVALMPQWDFLNFLSAYAKRLNSFQLLMQHEARDLIWEDGRVNGVVVQNEQREVQIRAKLVVGCDGRHSLTRSAAGLEVIEHGVPIDVLWFRISREQNDPRQVLGNVNYGKALILINRGDYFQAGLIIAKGSYEQIKVDGLDALRADVRQIAPYLGDRVHELRDWGQIKILTVQINRLRHWYRPGLLCIGDAAHAMSPAGGVGINLAIQDAVATANILAKPLQEHRFPDSALAAVQKRREFPTRVTQTMQLLAHRGFARAFANPGPIHAPWQMKVVLRIPGVQRVLGQAVGVGARPEHIRHELEAKPRRFRLATAIYAAIGITGTVALIGSAAWRAWSRARHAQS
jgi:2-polyprenyl-6-methoxyphenol hydroxylase-like FAD-dependent oxidoreductase